MLQAPLFQDPTMYLDAARADVESAGGLQNVGSELWPHLDPVEAGKKLGNALNPKQKQQLSYKEFQCVKLLARERTGKSQLHSLESSALKCDLHWITQQEQLERKERRLYALMDQIHAELLEWRAAKEADSAGR